MMDNLPSSPADGRDPGQAVALAEQFVAACNAHDLDAILSCLAPGAVHHARLADYPMAGIVNAFQATWTAIPDLRWEVIDIVATGDTVIVVADITGTHSGPYLGQAGTGEKIKVRNFDYCKISGGKFSEHWGLMDELHLLTQIHLLDDVLLTQMS